MCLEKNSFSRSLDSIQKYITQIDRSSHLKHESVIYYQK
uniref:Uncharacterized protein n=1 Tax=Arundo donax TaxID=35708 RepID=A0A0A8Y4J2_ARUDO